MITERVECTFVIKEGRRHQPYIQIEPTIAGLDIAFTLRERALKAAYDKGIVLIAAERGLGCPRRCVDAGLRDDGVARLRQRDDGALESLAVYAQYSETL